MILGNNKWDGADLDTTDLDANGWDNAYAQGMIHY